MPAHALPSQNPTNSCAAHCAAVAARELLNASGVWFDKTWVEKTFWPKVQFQPDGKGGVVDGLASIGNTDPRRLVTETATQWTGLNASLRCHDSDKAAALPLAGDPSMQKALDGLFTMIEAATVGPQDQTLTIADGVFYNCAFLMLDGAQCTGGTHEGMHNILITRTTAGVWHYNPNEDVPAWVQHLPGFTWKRLDGLNGGQKSYAYTGVCVEMRL